MDITDRRKTENEVGIAHGKLVSVMADLQSQAGDLKKGKEIS
jgi:hypothetical protein